MTLPLTVEEVQGRGLVAVALTVRAGGDDDPPGRHGTAHLVEHLMFPRGAGEDSGHVALVEEAGGMCNAETHRDHTVFHTVAPADALPEILAWEARRLRRFAPAPATVRSENAIVAEEIRASDAGTRLWDTVLAALYPGARDAYGTVAELREMTPDEAEAFFRRHYRPERAVLSVAGDVDAGRTAELVEREFGGWTPPPVPCPADRTAPGPSPAPASASPSPSPSPSLSVPSSPSPSARPHGVTPRHEAPVPYHRDGVAIGHALADPRRDRGTYFAQAVLCEVLRRSRLPGLLTRTARLDAATVRCGYQGQWLASAAPDLALVLLGRAPGTGTDEAVGLWRDTLAELAAEPPGQEELRPALAVLRAACHRQADSLTARAVTHGRAALLFPGLDGTGPDTIPEHLAAVTAPEVSAAARALLTAPSTVRTLERATP